MLLVRHHWARWLAFRPTVFPLFMHLTQRRSTRHRPAQWRALSLAALPHALHSPHGRHDQGAACLCVAHGRLYGFRPRCCLRALRHVSSGSGHPTPNFRSTGSPCGHINTNDQGPLPSLAPWSSRPKSRAPLHDTPLIARILPRAGGCASPAVAFADFRCTSFGHTNTNDQGPACLHATHNQTRISGYSASRRCPVCLLVAVAFVDKHCWSGVSAPRHALPAQSNSCTSLVVLGGVASFALAVLVLRSRRAS